jgi:co-chaperonin GroES (HSP10)
MPNVAMKHEVDPRERVLAEIGDVSRFEIAHREVLIATYKRPERTKGGIILTPNNLKEDLYQFKAGLVLAIGPECVFPEHLQIEVHDWVVIRASDVWSLEVNFVPCCLAYDDQIRARIPHPELVW